MTICVISIVKRRGHLAELRSAAENKLDHSDRLQVLQYWGFTPGKRGDRLSVSAGTGPAGGRHGKEDKGSENYAGDGRGSA
jgi:hypothetical protein